MLWEICNQNSTPCRERIDPTLASGMVNIKLEPAAGLLTVATHKDW